MMPEYTGPSWNSLSGCANTDQGATFTQLSNGRRVRMGIDQVARFDKKGFEVVCITPRDTYVTLLGQAERPNQPAKYTRVRR